MFGYPTEVWEMAKWEIREVLAGRARRGHTISYSELVAQVTAIALEPRDPRLDELLSQVSESEHRAGRGMMSVLVVHQTGDLRPGKGFFDCARRLGLDPTDEDALWAREMETVLDAWGRKDKSLDR